MGCPLPILRYLARGSVLLITATLSSAALGDELTIVRPSPSTTAEDRFVEALLSDASLDVAGFELVVREMPLAEITDGSWTDESQLAISRLSVEAPLSPTSSAYSGLLTYPVLTVNASQQRALHQSAIGGAVAAELGDVARFPIDFFVGDQSGIIVNGDVTEGFNGKPLATFNPQLASLLAAVGAKPSVVTMAMPTPWGESGAIEGIETSFEGKDFVDLWAEVERPSLVFGFRRESGVVFADASFWNSLAPSLKEVLRNAISRASELTYETTRDGFGNFATQAWAKERGIEVVPGTWDTELTRKTFLDRFGSEDGENALAYLGSAVRPRLELNSYIAPSLLPRVYFVTDRHEFPDEPLRNRFGARSSGDTNVRCGELALERDSGSLGSYDADLVLETGQLFTGLEDCSSLVTRDAKHIVILVHGFWNNFEASLRRVLSFSRDVGGADLSVVVWSWPSQGDPGAYAYDGESAQESAEQLNGFVAQLRALDTFVTLTVVSHSMGARVVEPILASPDASDSKLLFVFVAPDAPRDRFKRRVEASKALVTLYAADHDLALEIAERVNGAARAGQGGIRLLVSPELETVDLSDDWPATHSHALDLPEAFADLSRLVITREGAEVRGLVPKQWSGLPYFTLH